MVLPVPLTIPVEAPVMAPSYYYYYYEDPAGPAFFPTPTPSVATPVSAPVMYAPSQYAPYAPSGCHGKTCSITVKTEPTCECTYQPVCTIRRKCGVEVKQCTVKKYGKCVVSTSTKPIMRY
jgi:hypothetical protein